MRSCPVCAKPLFYAPYAPEDTAKMACSDLNCVNAHGIIHTSFDFSPEPAVEYDHSKPTPTKGHTMTGYALNLATGLISQRDAVQQQIETHLGPFLDRYKEFLLELNPSYDSRDLLSGTFLEIDHETFSFTGEEVYKYGEYYTPSLNLPFAFVEDPEAYIANARQDEADRKERAAAKTAKDKKERIARLETQLEKARADLAKAEEEGTDEIKITATRNDVANLRDKV